MRGCREGCRKMARMAVNETMENEIGFGVRIRHRRMLMGLKLAELAEMAECSESMISKIENGKANPSLKALQRIAIALGTTAAALISTEKDETLIIRSSERPRLSISSMRSNADIVMESLAPHSPSRLLQANIHVVQPGEALKAPTPTRARIWGTCSKGNSSSSLRTKPIYWGRGIRLFSVRSCRMGIKIQATK